MISQQNFAQTLPTELQEQAILAVKDDYAFGFLEQFQISKERCNNKVSFLGELFFRIKHYVLRIISGIFDAKHRVLGGKRIILK